jgi:hypothetical protein
MQNFMLPECGRNAWHLRKALSAQDTLLDNSSRVDFSDLLLCYCFIVGGPTTIKLDKWNSFIFQLKFYKNGVLFKH